MKPLRAYIPLLCSLLVLACDIDERAITDPAEMVEKGIILVNRGSYQRAKPLLEKAVVQLDRQGNTGLELQAYGQLITVHERLGEFSAALDRISAAHQIAKKTGDFRADAGFSIAEGNVYADAGFLGKSVSSYAAAKQLAVTFNDAQQGLDADLRAARALLWNGRVNEANQYYQSLLQSEQNNPSDAVRAEILLGVGRAFRLNGHTVEATNSLTQALGNADASDVPRLRARILHERGLLQSSQQNINGAITDFRDGVNVLRRAREGRDYEVLLLFRIGESYMRLGRTGDAQKYFSDAMEVAKLLGDKIAENYLLLWTVRANYASMTLDQRAQTLPRLLESYDQIATRFRASGHRTGEAIAFGELAAAHRHQGNTAGVVDALSKAFELQTLSAWDWMDAELHRPFVESFGVTDSRREWYDELAGALIETDRTASALRIIELSRSRLESAQLEQIEVQFRHPQLKARAKELRDEESTLHLRFTESAAKLGNRGLAGNESDGASMRKRLSDSFDAFQQNVDRLTSQHVNYTPLFPVSARQADGSDVAQYIPRGGAVIEYVFAKDRLAIVAITRSRTVLKFSPMSSDSVKRSVQTYLQLLNDPSVFSAEASAADVPAMTRFSILSTQLYDALIHPLDELPEKNLIIVSNPVFGSLPFHALERQDRGNVRYTIEARSVDYIPSLTALKFRTTTTARIRDIVAFGNPTGKQWSLDYELRDIRSFFKNARVNIGLETSWNNVRQATGDVMQIATDFQEARSTAPLGSLVLSNGLMVEESETVAFEKLMEQTPPAVAILSNQSSQGISLNQIHALVLRTNGTADVFLNCWTADRKAAKFFSEYFYTHLSEGLAPGDAYRQALINLLKTREMSHPHSWAQFFHFGVG